MLETPDDLARLQSLLDGSHARSTEHLRGIIKDDRTLSATQIAGLLTGMKVITAATVTAHGEPRISAMDGHFLHGTWTFSTSRTSAKARHLARRPAVSVAHATTNIRAEPNAIAARFTSHRVVTTQQEYPQSAAACRRSRRNCDLSAVTSAISGQVARNRLLQRCF